MSSNAWLIGETARLSVEIADAANAAADPGALRLKVKNPVGTVQTYTYGVSGEVVRDALGAYHADILLATSGQWAWRWETDAPNAGAVEGALSVDKSRI
jgi:hypothetical protein